MSGALQTFKRLGNTDVDSIREILSRITRLHTVYLAEICIGRVGTAQALTAKNASCLSSVHKKLSSQGICKFLEILPDTL